MADNTPVGYDENGNPITEITVTASRLTNWPLYAIMAAVLFIIWSETK